MIFAAPVSGPTVIVVGVAKLSSREGETIDAQWREGNQIVPKGGLPDLRRQILPGVNHCKGGEGNG